MNAVSVEMMITLFTANIMVTFLDLVCCYLILYHLYSLIEDYSQIEFQTEQIQ